MKYSEYRKLDYQSVKKLSKSERIRQATYVAKLINSRIKGIRGHKLYNRDVETVLSIVPRDVITTGSKRKTKDTIRLSGLFETKMSAYKRLSDEELNKVLFSQRRFMQNGDFENNVYGTKEDIFDFYKKLLIKDGQNPDAYSKKELMNMFNADGGYEGISEIKRLRDNFIKDNPEYSQVLYNEGSGVSSIILAERNSSPKKLSAKKLYKTLIQEARRLSR